LLLKGVGFGQEAGAATALGKAPGFGQAGAGLGGRQQGREP
jgi:hypothetical protein